MNEKKDHKLKAIEQKILRFIKEKSLFEKGDKVLVAFSGGPDSGFLLYVLNKFKKKLGIEIAACHINHGLRGTSAQQDEEFCKNFSKKEAINFYSVKKNVERVAKKNSISIEEAGREVRYSEFQKLLKKIGFNKIATAHTADDNAETMLLNLIKGTGLRGISGIPIKRENIIRPVIFVTKREILSYLKNNNIEFRLDETNFDSVFERNFLRNQVIPLIKSRLNNQFEETMFNSSEIFKNYYSYVQENIEDKFKSSISFKGGNLFISLKSMESLHPALKSDLFKTAIERNFSVQLVFNDIKSLNLLADLQKGKRVNLSNNLVAIKEKDGISVKIESYDFDTKKTKVTIGNNNVVNGIKITLTPQNKKDVVYTSDKNCEFVTYDKIQGPVYVRNWQKGDRFIPLGMRGFKKVSDFLTDCGIASSEKKRQLVLINKNCIVWLVGLRIDNRFKITSKTKKSLRLCIQY